MRRPSSWIVVALLALAGCSAGFDGTVVTGKGFAFRVGPIPPSWQRVEVSHAAIAFRDEAAGLTVAANARCKLDGEDVPLNALTQHLFLQFTDRKTVEERVVPFDGREALHTVIEAKLDGVPKRFDVWVLKKDGCVYDLFAITPPGRESQEFDRFARGFATVSHGP